MADITRETFSEANRFQKVLGQRGRLLLDSEANELQDILRVLSYRIGYLTGYDGRATGLRVESTGAANQIRLTVGSGAVDGIPLILTAPLLNTTLTTPGAPRVDSVYLRITETEVSDPSPVPELGEQTRRRQITLSLEVVEGGGFPASTGDPWTNGVLVWPLATISRQAGVGIVNNSWITHVYRELPGQTLNEIVTFLNGVVERVHAGTRCLIQGLTADTPLRFDDAVLTSEVYFSDKPAAVEEGGAGSSFRYPSGGAVTPGDSSVVRMLNARTSISVGDGVNTFGDFNGVNGIQKAVTFCNAVARPMKVVVKAGLYEVDDANLVPAVTDAMELVAEALPDNGNYTVKITDNQTVDLPTFTVADRFCVRGIEFVKGGSSNTAISFSLAQALVESCLFSGQGLSFSPQASTREAAVVVRDSRIYAGSGDAITIQNPATDTESFVFENCSMECAGSYAICAIYPGTYQRILFRNCEVTTGLNPVVAPIRNNGIFCFRDLTGAVTVDTIQYENCVLQTAGGGANSILLRQKIGIAEEDGATATSSALKNLRFFKCDLKCRNNAMGFFLVGPNFGLSFGLWKLTFSMEDCRIDLGGYRFQTEPGATNGASVHIEALRTSIRQVQVHNIHPTLFSTVLVPTDWLCAVRLNSTLGGTIASDDHTVGGEVSGLSLSTPENYVGALPGTKAISLLSVGSTTRYHLSGLSVLIPTLLAGDDVVTACAVHVTDTTDAAGAPNRSSGITIRDSNIALDSTALVHGVWVNRARSTQILDSHISAPTGAAVFLPLAGYVNRNTLRIAGNTLSGLYGVYASGVSADQYPSVSISDNEIIGCASYGIYLAACVCQVTNNRVHDNAGTYQIFFNFGPTTPRAATCVGNWCGKSGDGAGAFSPTGLIRLEETAANFSRSVRTGFDTISGAALGDYTSGLDMAFNIAELSHP